MSLGAWVRERWRREAASASADPRELLLAAVPVVVGLVGATLVFPRAVVPERVPVPHAAAGSLEREAADDDARAVRAKANALAPETRELGSAFRAWNRLAVRTDEAVEREAHGQAVRLGALARAVREHAGDEALLDLRAVQLDTFLAELRAFEASGVESAELEAVGGNVVDRMRAIGWIDGTRLRLSERTWRVLYKELWGRSLGLTGAAPFAPSLDAARELVRVQLEHPHPAEVERGILDVERQRSTTAEDCARVAAHELAAADNWRLKKVEAWALADPAYPASFARGVLLFRLGRFPEAARAFSAARERGGAYALRAFFHERAALVAAAVE